MRAQEGRGAGVRPTEPLSRVALIIGNTDYEAGIGKLKNPANDATDMAAALGRLGFSLVGGKAHLNLNKRQMLELIREFGSRIRKGGVGVFYFAGHGVQIEKRNYLIPITDALRYQEDAEFEAVDADQILREMEYAENTLNILILDACRNNNLPRKTRNVESGLGEPQRKPSGVFIAYAARDGQTAAENPDGRNGLYTQELLKHLETPNLRLEDIFIKTRREVKKLSNRKQEPIEYGSLDDVFFFKVDESTATVARPGPSPASVTKSDTSAKVEDYEPGAPPPKTGAASKDDEPESPPRTKKRAKRATENYEPESSPQTKKRASVGAFTVELGSCARSGNDVLCLFMVSHDSAESKQFNLCHADYRAKRGGVDVTHALDNLGNDYALAESFVGAQRWAQAFYNKAVLAPGVPVQLSLKFVNVAAESRSFTLIRIAVAEQTNMLRLGYADFRNVHIVR